MKIWTIPPLVILLSLALAPKAWAATLEDDRMDDFVSQSKLNAPVPETRFKGRGDYGFFNFSSAPMEQVNQRAARIEAYNYFSLGYRLSATETLALRPAFLLGTKGTNYRDEYKETSFSWADVFLNYKVKYIASRNGGDLDLGVDWRLYFPTSEESQRTGMITRLRPEINIKNSLRRLSLKKWSFVSRLEPDYYFQGRTASLDDKGEKALGNRNYGYQGVAGIQYDFTRNVGAAVGIYHAQYWYYSSPANDVRDSFVTEQGGVDFSLGWGIGPAFLIAGISQKRDVLRPRSGFQLMKDSESEYYLLNTWRL